MKKINLFLAEDSSLIRNLLKSFYKNHDAINLVDTAADGEEALEKLENLDVDIIVLDIVMPKLNGLETLKRIRRKNSSIPIIMYSGLTSDASAVHTVEALTFGATDYCQKPVGFGGQKLCADDSIAILTEKIISLVQNCHKTKFTAPTNKVKSKEISKNHYDLIVIGSSTGGPEALKSILSGLAGKLPPVLITQHMPPKFTTLLAKNLNEPPFIEVAEGQVGDVLKAGKAYLAPGNHHMVLKRDNNKQFIIDLNQDEQVNSCRPSVDVMFDSVAECFLGHVLLIVLTGMGSDGANGCEHIKSKNNCTVVIQNKETSTVWGMPAAIYDRELYDSCLSLHEIRSLLYRLSCTNAL